MTQCTFIYFQNTMNILIAASRGGGLASMIRGFNVTEDVNPGASLRELTGRAIARIPPPGCATNKTHVYILAGIPDITDKHTSQNRYYRYTECTYTENSNATIARLKKEIQTCKNQIIAAGAIPIFCTITHVSIAEYNKHLLNEGKTTILYHQDHYTEMQIQLEVTINEINHYIDTVNHSQNMSTPMCHSAIRHRRGKKGGRKYMKNIYRKLKDGVHGTKETRKLWAAAIEGAIRNNRNTKDDPLSPKRAWRRERRTPRNF